MKSLGILLIFSYIANAFIASPKINSSPKIDLNQNVVVFQFVGDYPKDFLLICEALRLVCGEEVFPEAAGRGSFAGTNKRMPLKTALDSMIRRTPRYKWEVTNDVLILSPRIANRYSPLDIRVRHFKAVSKSPQEIEDEVENIMGLHQEIADEVEHIMGLHPGKASTTLGPAHNIMEIRKSNIRISLDLYDVTTREILNAAVRAAGPGLWHFQYRSHNTPGSRNSVTLYFF
jgi:hypothetical protein